jgi:hypothetical protein
MYTALTRASITCIVIDGQPIDETLEIVVNLSLKALGVQFICLDSYPNECGR